MTLINMFKKIIVYSIIAFPMIGVFVSLLTYRFWWDVHILFLYLFMVSFTIPFNILIFKIDWFRKFAGIENKKNNELDKIKKLDLRKS